MEVGFARNVSRLRIHVYDNDKGKMLIVDCGWTVLIDGEQALEYVDTFNTNPNHGFYEHDGMVILTHGAGKIDLSRDEYEQVESLIRRHFSKQTR